MQALSKENIATDFTDAYWEQRYTVRTSKRPAFLERVSDKILITGKYLNVIRECGQSITASGASAPASSSAATTEPSTALALLPAPSSAASGKALSVVGPGAGAALPPRQRLRYTTNEKEYVQRIAEGKAGRYGLD